MFSLDELIASLEAFIKEAKAQQEKGNKSAGRRARVLSLKIEKALKVFRKVSVAQSK